MVTDMRDKGADEAPAPPAQGVLAGLDSAYFSVEATVGADIRDRLDFAKQAAQVAAKVRQVYCPDWLGARVYPNGDKGGCPYLIETDDFTVKVSGEHIRNRPGVYIEMRSHALHTHAPGAPGACEAALAWVRDHLFADQDATLVNKHVSFAAAKLSRADLHFDWQGGWSPSLAAIGPDLRRLIRPGSVKWQLHGDGGDFTGLTFGKGNVLARLYNKTIEANRRNNDAYYALLVERNGDAYDHQRDVWRLEFQLRREGVKGFKLYAPPDDADDDVTLDAELSAEDLQHVGTLPRFFAHMSDVWRHLTQHWLRLAVDDGTARRSRWPTDATWQVIQETFALLAAVPPLDEDGRLVVRGTRYTGRNRVLRRLELGLAKSLEVEDSSAFSAALATLQASAERLVAKESERAERRRAAALAKYGYVPPWVERGMGALIERAEQRRHRVQMLLGVAGARGVLPLELKGVTSVADLLLQHLDDLEAEANEHGGIQAVLRNHFAKTYKANPPVAETGLAPM